MGSRQSTSMEEAPSLASLAGVPRGPVGDPPKMIRPETFQEKFIRKFSSEPLVPIGCLVTAYFLGSGIGSFYKRDAKRSQRMMRLRVGSQFATLLIFVGYYGIAQFDLRVAPMHQDALKIQEASQESTSDPA